MLACFVHPLWRLEKNCWRAARTSPSLLLNLDAIVFLHSFLQTKMRFHTLNWKPYKGTKWLLKEWPLEEESEENQRFLGRAWTEVEQKCSVKWLIPHVRIFIDCNDKRRTQLGGKVILTVGLSAESLCGMWVQTQGLSQSMLVTSGLGGNSRMAGKGNQTNSEKTTMTSAIVPWVLWWHVRNREENIPPGW